MGGSSDLKVLVWGIQTAGNIHGIPGLSACPRAVASITQQWDSGSSPVSSNVASGPALVPRAALMSLWPSFLCDFPAFVGTRRAVAWKESQSLAMPLRALTLS